MLEKGFEQSVIRYVKRCGGRAYKFVSPGRSGVSDRICVFPGGLIVFVEVKRPGLRDGRSPQQVKFERDMRRLGCNVWRVNNIADFKRRLAEKGVKPYEV